LITVGKICFDFDFIIHTAYIVDTFALTTILPSVTLIDIVYLTTDAKATLASF